MYCIAGVLEKKISEAGKLRKAATELMMCLVQRNSGLHTIQNVLILCCYVGNGIY